MSLLKNEDHDGGLRRDLSLILPRRHALGLLASAAPAILLGGCAKGRADTASLCVAASTETNGPFPADGSNSIDGARANLLIESGIVRSDIRPSLGSVTGTADGVPVEMSIALVDVNRSCAPLSGYAVYVWQCDANGEYSLYEIPDRNYLRGVGVTGADGKVAFTTVFPGCYPGRYPHIHFEVYDNLARATSFANRRLVSQLALPEDACAEVYGQAGLYRSNLAPFERTSIASDGVFNDNSAAQMAAQTLKMAGSPQSGYSATCRVGIAV
ncbi:MAG: intradiol ring-cleavage dioxygenase [Parvularculaceae bacterium]